MPGSSFEEVFAPYARRQDGPHGRRRVRRRRGRPRDGGRDRHPRPRQLHGARGPRASSRSRSPKSGCANSASRSRNRARPAPVNEQAGALVEAREGVTTGISAADRARTIQVIGNPKSTPADIVMPGHILPLMALSGGVMMRLGRAEGAVDLMRCAAMRPAAALCAILDDNGEMANAAGAAQIRRKAFASDRVILAISFRIA